MCCACFAIDEQLPDTATLSANRMRFDAQTGDFLADGNVTIKAGDLSVNAPSGSGNVDRRETSTTASQLQENGSATKLT